MLTWKGRCAIIYFAAQRPAGNRGTGGLKIQRTGGISMSTYMAKKGEVERVCNRCGGQAPRPCSSPGCHLAQRQKQAHVYPAHVDCGDHVIIINCADVVLTGKSSHRSTTTATRVISAILRRPDTTPSWRRSSKRRWSLRSRE